MKEKKKQGSKKMRKCVGIILSMCVLVGCSRAGCMEEDFSTVANEEKEDVSSKVRFEGVGTIRGESSSEIADAINNVEAEKTKLIIQLDNEYDSFIERPDEDDVSVGEAQEILRQQRANVKEYYSETNKEILDTLIEYEIEECVDYLLDFFVPL